MKDSNISDWPALQAWLDKHHARFCYSLLPRIEHKITPSIEAWKVNGRILHVVLYPDAKGWDIVTSCDDNSTERTLIDAEQRLGIASVAPATPTSQATAYRDPMCISGHVPDCDCRNPPAVGDPFMAFAMRGVSAQQAVDTAIATAAERTDMITQASTLAEIVRLYLDSVERNRSDFVELDDRIEAREQMAKHEELLKQLVGWKPNLAPNVGYLDRVIKGKKPSKPTKKGKKAKR